MVLKEISVFINDLVFVKKFDNLLLVFGYYIVSILVNDWWSLGNVVYYVFEVGGEMLDGFECNVSVDGCGFNYDINLIGDVCINVFYIIV